MEDFFSKAAAQFKLKLPFVLYNKPNNGKLIGFFQNDDQLHTAGNFEESGFIFAPFNGNEAVLIPENQSKIISIYWISDTNITNSSVTPSDNEKARTAFENLVNKGISAIHDHQFQKVVLSRKEIIALENFDLIDAFQKLLHAYSTAFTYCFFHPKIGLWLGATPEQFLKVKTNRFETIALAGTQKFEGNENVNWENKEKEEQQFVTDFILENLENVTSDITFSNPYTYKAGNLLHIKTDISGSLADHSDVKQLIQILHPTPAVCGFPRAAARDFILENEGYDRKYYSGYLGELYTHLDSDQTTTDLFVNLRCMEIEDNSVLLYIGCGVTKDSDPGKEFEETVNKSMTMKKILN